MGLWNKTVYSALGWPFFKLSESPQPCTPPPYQYSGPVDLFAVLSDSSEWNQIHHWSCLHGSDWPVNDHFCYSVCVCRWGGLQLIVFKHCICRATFYFMALSRFDHLVVLLYSQRSTRVVLSQSCLRCNGVQSTALCTECTREPPKSAHVRTGPTTKQNILTPYVVV